MNAQKKMAKKLQKVAKKMEKTNPVEHLGCSSPERVGWEPVPQLGLWPAQLVDWSFSLFFSFLFSFSFFSFFSILPIPL